MGRFVAIIILLCGLLCSAFCQRAWELKQEDLENMIQQSSLIVTGQIAENIETKALEIKVIETWFGGKIAKVPLAGINGRTYNPEYTYMAFLKSTKNGYTPVGNLGIIKTDVMLSSRVYNQILKFRLNSSSYVVLATVLNIEEVAKDQEIEVTATCQVVTRYRGNLPDNFVVKYTRIPGSRQMMVTLFNNLNYVFFLKGDANALQLANPYDGALLEKLNLLRELKKAVEGNPWELEAEVPVDGLILLAEADTLFPVGSSIELFVSIRNTSSSPIEIYHNDEQLAYFIVFHVINSENKIVASEYRAAQDIPNEVRKTDFLILKGPDEFSFPTFNLQQYYPNLSPGKYLVYVEYNLNYRYSGKSIGKSGWSGKLISKAVPIEITN